MSKRRGTIRRRNRARGRGFFRHLMVPIDLSDRHERVLRMVLALAADHACRVTLFHVVQRVPTLATAELAGFYRRLVKTADRRLRQVARSFTEHEIDVRTQVRIGEPAIEIIRAATRERVDVLVMSSHKVRPGRGARSWGTTSYKVGIFSQCPILLVK
jgi:nucleotide-binding universal stress UspA family protein